MDGFEEQPHGARLGAGALALLLDDGAEHVWTFAVEQMTEMTTPLGVDAQEGDDEERGDVTVRRISETNRCSLKPTRQRGVGWQAKVRSDGGTIA